MDFSGGFCKFATDSFYIKPSIKLNMKKLLFLIVALSTMTTYAAEPLKVLFFKVEMVTPEADVNIATLKTRHNGDPEKVTLSYKVSDDRVTIKKYGDYDIVDMGDVVTASITVIATDGVSEARSTWIHARTDMSVDGYYQKRELWEAVAKPFLGRGEPFKFVEADPNLPNVLIIGNSISIGYTPYVRKDLAGVANVYRVPENAGDTKKGLQSLDHWLSDMKWDVIHVNWGLHDLKYTVSDEHPDVPLDQYEKNLRVLLKRLEETGAKIIWAQTSYVPDGVTPRRDLGSDVQYNDVAKRVVKEFKGIVVDDQYKLTKANLDNQKPHDVHFEAAGYEQQGAQAAKYILKALK